MMTDVNHHIFSCIINWYPFPVYRRIAKKMDISITNYTGNIFNPLVASTLTIGGDLQGVTLHEERDRGKFPPSAAHNIIHVGSNFEDVWLEGHGPPPPPDPSKPKRGRKPKPRETKRVIHGTGKYFASQITFTVLSRVKTDKVYKFKVFRTGTFQIPGVLDANMSDLKEPLENLRLYFERYFPTVTIAGCYPQMRNCKTIISDPRLRIATDILGRALQNLDPNPMNVSTATYINDKTSAKTVIKFTRTTETRKKKESTRKKKESTLKVLSQKINYEGCVYLDDIVHIHEWFNDFILSRYYQIIIDDDAPPESDSDSD